MFNPEEIKKQFPIFNRTINGKPLVYLDNAATTQKPQSVIDAISHFYENTNANIHRGVHTLSEEATEAYEGAREAIAKFINAQPEEIVLTRNTTEAINLVAYSWGEEHIKEDDEIIISELEHHSNFIPWQQLCNKKGAKLKVIPIKSDYTLDMEAFRELLSDKTKLVAISAMSNVLGTIIDVKEITKLAHNKGAIVLVDGAQSAAHIKTDVKDLDCDFFTLSAHKMLGPTGVGVLYGKREILQEMEPFLFGGGMVKVVQLHDTTFADTPQKFEAGTSEVANVIAFKKALELLTEIGMDKVHQHGKELMEYAQKEFAKFDLVTTYGPADLDQTGALLSFTIKGIHPHDIASIFNNHGIAIRGGHHCAQPLMQRLQVPATARISFYIYNTIDDIDKAIEALKETINTFK